MTYDKYDPAFWPQEETIDSAKYWENEEDDTLIFLENEYIPKERPECPLCGKRYICTHEENDCEMCLMCERIQNNNLQV